MPRTKDYGEAIRTIFSSSLKSVQPHTIFQTAKCLQILTCEGRDYLKFATSNEEDNEKKLQLNITNKRCHLVGFGKSVYGMAVEVEKILQQRLVSGIISVPVGTQEKFKNDPEMKLMSGTKIEVIERNKKKFADKMALECGQRVKQLIEKLTEDDVLLVLISGGGSALLPLPKSPITLEEKLDLVHILSGKGATVDELNIIRFALSEFNGGKLSDLGTNACKIVSLIISDIVNDPLELIANGLMAEFHKNTNETPEFILQKFNLIDEMPPSIINTIRDKTTVSQEELENSSVFIIGNNYTAVNSAILEAKFHHFAAIPITCKLQANIIDLSQSYFDLALAIKMFILNEINGDELREKCNQQHDLLKFKNDFVKNLIKGIEHKRDICLIAGGKPYVKLVGHGIGGRNQEMALRYGLLASENVKLHDTLFLACATNGRDGTTNAAGAIGSPKLIAESQQKNEILRCLENNDSYNFFVNFQNGSQHIITGHTGTNVMDIHALIIKNDRFVQ